MNILVIKLGALGDFVQAFDAFAAIRTRHPGARLTLLTTAPFAELGERSPWFDRVLVDARPNWLNVPGVLRLRRKLQGFDFVYDLQTSGRSGRYFALAGRPPWSGIARGASHPHTNKARDRMHNSERLRSQLVMAGVSDFPRADLSWFTAAGPTLPEPYALLVPGCSPHLPEKQWPTERFGAFARLIAQRGVLPVVIGTEAESDLGAIISAACPETRDLTGQTTLFDLGGLAARASLAVGNDTGPIHLAAAVGCPCIALFSARSNPGHAAPRGPVPGSVTVLREPDLADLALERVAASLP
jgi:ADP-heptose:LPS heptosyltransferase